MEKLGNLITCINCNGSHPVSSKRVEQIGRQTPISKSIISHWVSPHNLAEHDIICIYCLAHVARAEHKIISQNNELTIEEIEKSNLTKVENRQHCVMCGISIARLRAKSLNIPSPTEEQQKILGIIGASIGVHKKINSETKTCHNCWHKTVRVVKKLSTKKDDDKTDSVVSEPDLELAAVPELNTIELPKYKKISTTKDHCVFQDCTNKNLQPVSTNLQVKTLKDYNVYIPTNSMICDKHLYSNNWKKLHKEKTNDSTFTAEDIEQILSLVQTKANTEVNFKNYMTIDENTFIYFLGINRETLSVILKYLPQIKEMDHGILGLIGLFIKHENGGPNDRIASLLELSEETLQIAMENVKEILVDNPDVTTNMGIEYLLKKHL